MTIFSINSGSFGDVTVTGIVSASTLKGDGSQITSVSYDNIASKPTLISSSTQVTSLLPTGSISSSAQINYPDISNIPANIVSSSGQVTALLPANTVSSSGQISLSGISGTTFSNNDFSFPLNVTVNGLLTATSQSIIYITSSQLNVGSNDIILNTTEQLRFGGLTIFDSGSANQSGSLFWDSLHNVWLYVHAGTSNTSSIVITGPENTGVLGSEAFLTPNRVPKSGLIGDHIVDSQISDNGTTVGMTGNLSVTGSLTIATNAFFVSGSGNVGIGTSTVDTKLVIAGNNDALTTNNTLRFIDTDTFTQANQQIGKIEFYSSDVSAPGASVKAYIGAFAEDTTPDAYLAFATDTSTGTPTERMRITSAGRVGIGTTNPESLLEVRYDSNTDSRLVIKNINTGSSATANVQLRADGGGGGLAMTSTTYSASGLITSDAVYLYASDDASNGLRINTEMAAPVLIGTNNVERMRIDASGNVGIGTTNPTSRLEVRVNRTSSTNATVLILSDNVTGAQTNGVYKALRATSNGGNSISEIRFLETDGTNNNTSIAFATAQSAAVLSERMRIDNNGDVGIGTTNPGAKLDVDGSIKLAETGRLEGRAYPYTTTVGSGADATTTYLNAGSTATYQSSIVVAGGNATNPNTIIMSTTSTERMRIDSSGNVGIGLTNPQSLLHISGSGTQIRITGEGGGNSLVLQGGTGSNMKITGYNYGSSTAVPLYISVDGANTIMQSSGGNVGIGITNPSADNRLTVASSNTATQYVEVLKLKTTSTGDYHPSILFENTRSSIANVAKITLDSGPSANTGELTFLTPNSSGTLRRVVAMNKDGGLRCINTISVGDGTPSTSGAGITFPATQNASSDANTLDDYEEGSWTPALYDGGSDRGPSYAFRSGNYTKIGKVVFLQWGFKLSSKGTSPGSGEIRIYGLPFAGKSHGSYQEPNTSVATGLLNTAANAYSARMVVGDGSSFLFGRVTSANADTTWTYNDLTNDSWIIGEIFYYVS